MNQGTIIAVSIIVAGGLIAGAVLFGGNGLRVAGGERDGEAQAVDIQQVTAEDHIFGNPDAPIKIVEFSDFECPFCSRFHPTVERVIEEFDGEVAWVYRHFPLNIHRNAEEAGEASECVAELGGNNAFWSFADDLFKNQQGLGTNLYLDLAEGEGIARADMQACLDSDRHIAAVRADLQEALNAGARGTPFSVVIGPDGNMVSFSGALPYENVVSVINSL